MLTLGDLAAAHMLRLASHPTGAPYVGSEEVACRQTELRALWWRCAAHFLLSCPGAHYCQS